MAVVLTGWDVGRPRDKDDVSFCFGGMSCRVRSSDSLCRDRLRLLRSLCREWSAPPVRPSARACAHAPARRYSVEILPFAIRAKGFTVFSFAVSLSLIFNQCVGAPRPPFSCPALTA